MADINLLPTDIAPKGPTGKLANALKRVAIYGSLALVLFLMGVGAYVLFIQTQIRTSKNQQQQLEASIKSLEQTEQRVVLLKDRIKKAGTILSEETSTPAIDSFESFTLTIPQTARLAEAKVTTERTEVSYVVSSSSDLTQLMAGVFSLEEYKKINLTSFGFSPTAGYLVSLEME
jgi:Tfp pilus assembly protein PilN